MYILVCRYIVTINPLVIAYLIIVDSYTAHKYSTYLNGLQASTEHGLEAWSVVETIDWSVAWSVIETID